MHSKRRDKDILSEISEKKTCIEQFILPFLIDQFHKSLPISKQDLISQDKIESFKK